MGLLALLTLDSVAFNLDKIVHEVIIGLLINQKLVLVVAGQLSGVVGVLP